jgi:hypothetical protein
VDADEIIKGVTQGLGIVLSREEQHLLAKYLDKDGEGQVTF